MSNIKQVKVDNWGIYFLQRLKHFFNRTDYCDLTLQFQDNAQLKVHRLVLSACTEYFELLERTCEMYEDCLVMPDDLQADVVVPIVNFMYTGQLEFRQDLLEKLYQTSLIMNMPVLSKLLDAHRHQTQPSRPAPVHSYSKHSKSEQSKQTKMPIASSSGLTNKRSYNRLIEHDSGPKSKRPHLALVSKSETFNNGHQNSDTYNFPVFSERNKHIALEPRPTRYELPEELDEDNIFDNSFTSISYTSKPLMIHPETVKQYGSKKLSLFEDTSSSKRLFSGTSNDIVECRKISINNTLFDDEGADTDDNEIFQQNISNKEESKDASQLFDQIIENDAPKLTIETKESKQGNNIDHAKIISEVLKKYPHLVKSNKNIKLKILNTPSKTKKKPRLISSNEEKEIKPKQEPPDFTYETDVIDSKEAAHLIALGAENVKGPWICLICGTPGRALHFTSYYKFRRHLVDVHNEKPVPSICEYCGLKSLKRNYLLHHLYTKHGIEPPANYYFPKCNYCNYVALTEGFLVKHKLTHTDHKGFRCNVCASAFGTSSQLLGHIQSTGHKYSADRKANLQCIYCLKVFLRETNLYTHLKTHHKQSAKSDGIIDDSEDEKLESEERVQSINVKSKPSHSKNDSMTKFELPVSFDNSCEDVQYEIEHKGDGNIQLVSKKSKVAITKNKILNTDFHTQNKKEQLPKTKVYQETVNERNDFLQEVDTSSPNNNEEILVIDNQEYIIQNYQLIPKKERSTDDYSISEMITQNIVDETVPSLTEVPMDFQNIQNIHPETSGMMSKKNANINQPIQIVVSNEEEYKALMASNHSIIFEDRDPNKTLAVLAAQNQSTLETNTIDLQNTQSNEMMIIPENYPISVSETVSADNSNIVVVYSHPIDDQNKQYQLITSQGIEAQFVQTSAMITQNFETITTCAPVMNAHVISTPEEHTWANNANENMNKLPTSQQETQSIATMAPIQNIPTDTLNELPEIQLTAASKEMPVDIEQSIVTENQSTQNVNLFSEPKVVPDEISQPSIITTTLNKLNINTYQNKDMLDLQHDDTEPNTITAVNDEISTEEISVSVPQSNEVNSHDLLHQNTSQCNNIINESKQIGLPVLASDDVICDTLNSETNTEIAVPNSSETNLDNSKAIIEEEIHSISVIQNEEVVDNLTANVAQSSHIVESQETLPQQSVPDISVIIEEQRIPTVETDIEQNQITDENMSNKVQVTETLENITEDPDVEVNTVETNVQVPVNSETFGSDLTNKEDLPKVDPKENIVSLTSEWSEDESDSQQEHNTPEVEESIENIQQEIDKHKFISEEVQFSEEKQDVKPTKCAEEVCQSKSSSDEKITSLLNDWDDNDSQEEDDSNNQQKNISDSENTVAVDNNAHEEVIDNGKTSNETVAVKDDKIKSLVSDWDDEEEEQEVKD